ncbi:MAG: carboxypeptidase regulatory-like domain-containing protein [Candidatus Korobacteraceae bacterium]|jgi:hypothetical protein
MRVTLKALVLLTLLSFIATSALGQAESGEIVGTVRDALGAVIPGAAIAVRNIATGAVRPIVQSGNLGQFNVLGLTPGTYEVTVKSSSFALYRSKVEVAVGSHVTLAPILAVDKETTNVEVVAAGGTEINTQTPEISQLITPTQMAQLPSLNRNPYDFVALAGNVSNADRTATGGDQNSENYGVFFSLNGQRSSGTEILLDGAENIDWFNATYAQPLPIETVQEFRVITSNFDARYGRASGGVVSVTTKSGTNDLHGSAWEFNRVSALTANTVSNAQQDIPKGEYTRNDFGYTIGGPIIKKKLFFFQSTEWTRVRGNAQQTALVPDPTFLNNYAAPNVAAYFNAYGQNFHPISTIPKTTVNGQVMVGGVSPSSSAFGAIPDGTPILDVVSYSAPADAGGGTPQNTYNIIGRLDYYPSDRTQVFFRYALYSENDFNGGEFNSPYSIYNVGQTTYDNNALVSLTHFFSNNVFSSSKVSFTRLNLNQTYNQAALSVPELLLSNGATVNGQSVIFPGMWAQFAGVGGEPYGGPQNMLQLTQDFSWNKGKHLMRYGGQFNYIQNNRTYGYANQALELLGFDPASGLDAMLSGNLAFFNVAVNPQGKTLPCYNDPTNGYVITQGCLLNLPVTSPSFSRSYRYQDFAVYAQDNWRASQRLTLNYGLRWEFYGVQHNSNPSLDSNFYYGAGSNLFETIRNGSVMTAPNSPIGEMWKPNYGTLAPRVGFAYDVFGDGKTSLRGGFGISYERNFGNVTFNAIQNPPNYATIELLSTSTPNPVVSVNNYGPLGSLSGTTPFLPPSLRQIDQNINTAQTQFYSMALEHRLARNTIVALEYSGAHGVHLYDIYPSNALGAGNVYLGDAYSPALGNYSRPNNYYGDINTRGSGGTSRYNGLNIRFQTQNLHGTGLTMVVNYTWSHSMDDLSSTFSSITSGNIGYLNPLNPKLDWGSSDFDVRHRLVVSPIWETPWFKNGKSLKRQLLGGYIFTGVFTVRTGVPFSVFDSTASLNAGDLIGVPRYVPSTAIPSYQTGSGTLLGPNNYAILTLPPGVTFVNPALAYTGSPYNSGANPYFYGISDFGPYPSNMTGRNAFRGPGAWNVDLSAAKNFAVTERVKAEFRAEAFNVFNHHNMYVNAAAANVASFGGTPVPGAVSNPIVITGLKGGLGSSAIGGDHDERRFVQLALRVNF